MSIASRITEMETHINNAYTSIDNLGIDISSINKNIYNISTLLDTFYESLPKVNGIGASLSLSPTMVGKIKLNEIQGDTLQDGTPTPSSPVPIQSVTGLQKVNIDNKNLSKISDGTATINGLTITIQDGVITLNGTTTNATDIKFSDGLVGGNNARNNWLNDKLLNSTLNTTFSINVLSGTAPTSGFAVRTYVNGVQDANANTLQNNRSYTKSYTTDGIMNFIYAYVNTGLTFDNFKFTIQLENGDTATNFVPPMFNTYEVNLGTIELNKIGDYEDYIFKNEPSSPLYDDTLTLNSWYITKNIGKVVLDGTTGSFSNPSTNRFNIDNLVTDFKKSEGQNLSLSNCYKNFNQVGTNADFNTLVSNENYAFDFSSATSFTLRFKDTRYTNVSDFQTWLTNNKPIVNYVLATPTYTTITNTTLIEQLETLRKAKSKNGTTNINVDGSLPVILGVKALKGE